ncbi:hypothetical protein N9C27_05900 [Luminiphilus sp.]|nr:hypothetical protein [Luminiphilus sp.]
MDAQAEAYDLTIRFVMRKGEGNWPQLSRLSREERVELKRLATFLLDWDHEFGDQLEVGITDVAVLYDGVTPLYLTSGRHGLHIVDDAIVGFPSPIIRFSFSEGVDPDRFIKTVWMSQVRLQSEAGATAGSEPFYCEDHQGYTGIADPELVGEITNALRKASEPPDYRTDLSTLLAGLNLAVI